MGIRKFFPSLIARYRDSKFVIETLPLIEQIYFDANCLIHPVCQATYQENIRLHLTNPDKLELLMITNIINTIERIIDTVKPTKLIFIAIDGVAPMAKIKHQRLRRFRSAYDVVESKKYAHKYGEKFTKPWNNSAITPGTTFMNKLTSALMEFYASKGRECIISTAYSPGEGEHKILQHIRNNNYENESKVIYGMDSDLIYLCLITCTNNLYLMRDENMGYLHIDNLKEVIMEDMGNIHDYIFMGFFIGNDFLPSIPSTTVDYIQTHSGLDTLMFAYNYAYSRIKQRLITIENNHVFINQIMLQEIFMMLDIKEEEFFEETKKMKTSKYIIEYYGRKEFHNIPELFNLGFKSTPHNVAKQNYYKYYDNANCIDEYMNGLKWNSHYYFLECPNYMWFYPYKKAPFASDIHQWIKNNPSYFSKPYPIYYNNNFISPVEQLFMVLPIESYRLFPYEPDKFKRVMLSIPEYFPNEITLDVQGIQRYWQAFPNIKIIPPNIAKSLLMENNLLNNYNGNKANFKITTTS
jgi:5'-3' exonuclease